MDEKSEAREVIQPWVIQSVTHVGGQDVLTGTRLQDMPCLPICSSAQAQVSSALAGLVPQRSLRPSDKYTQCPTQSTPQLVMRIRGSMQNLRIQDLG